MITGTVINNPFGFEPIDKPVKSKKIMDLNDPISPSTNKRPSTLTNSKLASRKYINKLYMMFDNGSKTSSFSELSIDVLPDNVGYSYTPNYHSQNLLGRLSPIFMYTGGSAKVYTFSITVHEDILDKNKYESITEFVDQVKSFSYPRLLTDGSLKLPQVYFQLGEISGYGILKTNVKWQKPFRDGRYIVASIDFTMTIEQNVEQAEVYEIEVASGETGLSYDYAVNSGYSQEEFNDIQSFLKSGGYSIHISDFVTNGGSDAIIKAKEDYARQQFNYERQRLSDIYGMFAETDGTQKVKDIAIFKSRELKNVYNLVTSDTSDAEAIKKAKDAFTEYLDYYYDNVNLNMTREEKELIEETVVAILENMQVLAEEIVGYGKSN